MSKKKRQLNNLISLHDNEYKELSVKLNDIRIEYQKSTYLIEKMTSDIEEYTSGLNACMINDPQSYVHNYRNIKNYIIYLKAEVSDEMDRRNRILNNLNMLEEDCTALKVTMRGYDILIEQHDSEFRQKTIKTQNKEIDDMWLLKRTIHD